MFSQKSQLNHAHSPTSSYVVVKLVSMILGHDDLKPQDETDSSELELMNSRVWTLIGGLIEPYSRRSSATFPAGGYSRDHGKPIGLACPVVMNSSCSKLGLMHPDKMSRISGCKNPEIYHPKN